MVSKIVSAALLFSVAAPGVIAQAGPWAQCGGINFPATSCQSGLTCTYFNDYYSQCIPGSSGGTTASTKTTKTSTTKTTKTSSTKTSKTSSTKTSTVGVTTTSSGNQPTGTSISTDGLVGFGAGTTGGSGSAVTVSSCSELTAAAKNGGIIKINGLLSGCGVIRLVSSTTLLGVGSNSGIVNGGILLRDISNVIVRNLKFSPASGGDAVALDGASKVWLDHNDFYSKGLVGGKDDYDGLLDITHAGDLVTVSWNKFHDHWKGSLVGHSDSNASEDTGKLRVTYHHNYWYNVNSRLPSLRFGTGHIYSSCFEDSPTSGINSRMGANVLVEENSFTNVKLAIVTDLDSDQEGYARDKNNIFVNSDTRITQQSSWTPPYSYTPTPASQVCSTVKSQAGVGIIG